MKLKDKLLLMIPAIPTLLVMIIAVPVGFIYEALLTGFIAGQSMFENLNEAVRSIPSKTEENK